MRALLLSISILTATACGSPTTGSGPTSGPGSSIIPTSTGVLIRIAEDGAPSREIVSATPEQVWAILPAVYEQLGIEAGIMDSDGLVYGAPRFTGTRIGGRRTAEFMRCGSAGAGPSTGGYRIRLSIQSKVRELAEGSTAIETQVTGSGTPFEGTSTGVVRCVSTGDLEREIARIAGELLADG